VTSPEAPSDGGAMAEAQYDAAATQRYVATTPHRLKRFTSRPPVMSFGCGVIGLTVELPVMLLVLGRHPIPGSVWSESILLSVLPFLGIFFGAVGLDQLEKGQRGRTFAGLGLLIGIAEFVPILLFLLSQ
jgi:hypothetical protein